MPGFEVMHLDMVRVDGLVGIGLHEGPITWCLVTFGNVWQRFVSVPFPAELDRATAGITGVLEQHDACTRDTRNDAASKYRHIKCGGGASHRSRADAPSGMGSVRLA